MKQIISTNKLFLNTDNDRIMFLIEKVFNANSLETAITMEQVIEKGIEMNLCETYPRGKEDGHPWYPHTSTMCGIHKDGTLNGNYECYLHRAFVKRNGSKTKVFVYWVDRTRKAEVIGRNGKPVNRQAKVEEKKTPEIIWERKGTYTPDQMEAKVKENPNKFMIVDNKLMSIKFILDHPEKFHPAMVAVATANYKG